MADQNLDALFGELREVFDRVYQAGRHAGAEEALSGLVESARAKLSWPTSVASSASRPPRAQISEGGKKALATAARAPSGSIQREVLEIIGRALAPMSVQSIVQSGKVAGGQIKDTSVRMALKSLTKKGKVAQNDIGEWMLSSRHLRSDFEMPSDEDFTLVREAA